MPNYYSSSAGEAPFPGTTYLENARRTYDLSGRLARLNPLPYAFLQHLMMLRRDPTPDPKFVMLEQRHQWQRMNTEVQAAKTGISVASPTNVSDLRMTARYDKYGRVNGDENAPVTFVVGDMLDLEAEIDTGAGGSYEPARVYAQITDVGNPAAGYIEIDVVIKSVNHDNDFATTYTGRTIRFNVGNQAENFGGTFAEATGAPEGWTDQLSGREGYCEIKKTSVPIVSGTAMATVYRGVSSEWERIWVPKMNEHKAKLARMCMFGVGRTGPETGDAVPARFSWGMLPYIMKNGVHEKFSFAGTGYNQFMDFIQNFLEPEKGMGQVPLVLTSRQILGWLNKLGDQGFLRNTFPVNMAGGTASGGNPILDYRTLTGQLGHELTVIKTIFGTLAFVEDVTLRGMNSKYAVSVSLQNVAWRPLVGNGISRDTHVKENVQDNDTDGRKDLILTEAGLRIDLPETHAVLEFN